MDAIELALTLPPGFDPDCRRCAWSRARARSLPGLRLGWRERRLLLRIEASEHRTSGGHPFLLDPVEPAVGREAMTPSDESATRRAVAKLVRARLIVVGSASRFDAPAEDSRAFVKQRPHLLTLLGRQVTREFVRELGNGSQLRWKGARIQSIFEGLVEAAHVTAAPAR